MVVFSEPVDLPELLGRVADRWSRHDRANGRAIGLHVDDSIGVLEIDPTKLEQILDALVDNALRYALHSDVEIVARPSTLSGAAGPIEILVRDCGPGIAQELMPTLFETFNDFEDVSASKYGGAGLGLPLSHKLCRLMGASLAVKTGANAGATLVVTIPNGRPESNHAEPPIGDLAEAA